MEFNVSALEVEGYVVLFVLNADEICFARCFLIIRLFSRLGSQVH